jgi:O-antigen/teichoic acid export membrane protein
MARLFPAIFALIIVRIYSPDNFGIFVLYLTIASVLSIISTGKYENAIILAESAEEKRHIFWLSQKLNIWVNTVALIVLLLYIFIAGFIEQSTIYMLLLIPVYSFFFAAVQLVRNIFISKKQFGKLSVLEILRSVLTGIFQCSLFILPETGLFIGAAFAQLVTYIWYSRKLYETRWVGTLKFTGDELTQGKRYIDFLKFSVASEVFNFLSSQLPVFMIKPFFGTTMLGLYSFPNRYLSIPVQLVSTSISRVYVQKAQSLKNNIGELSELTLSLFKKQFLSGIIPFTILALWGQPLFRIIFGTEWEYSGFLAQLISPWLFLVMLGSPLSSIMIVMEKQKISMLFNVVLLIFRIISLLVGGLIFKDIEWAIGLYSLTGFIFFAWLCIYALGLAGVKIRTAALFSAKVAFIVIGLLLLLKLWL